jgi:hypothetical protein
MPKASRDRSLGTFGKKNMKNSTLVFIVLPILLSSCRSTPVVGELSPKAATRQAQQDYTRGHPKIYKAGGYVAYEPGILDNQQLLVANLPRDGSLAGCTNPNVRYSIDFATAYNREIVSLIQRNEVKE